MLLQLERSPASTGQAEVFELWLNALVEVKHECAAQERKTKSRQAMMVMIVHRLV